MVNHRQLNNKAIPVTQIIEISIPEKSKCTLANSDRFSAPKRIKMTTAKARKPNFMYHFSLG